MGHGLNIRKDAELDFLSLGALVHRLDPGPSFPQSDGVQDSRQRGEFNVAATFGLFWSEDGNCLGHVGLSDRRPDCRACPRDGREALL